MSVTISVPDSTALKQGGLLFNLPRELRDEIYRYLVKGNYVLNEPPKLLFEVAPVSRVRPHLNVLLVSKPIRNEAMAVLYSESRFRIYINFVPDEISRLSSLEPFKHLMKIELQLTVPKVNLTRKHIVQQSWKAMLQFIGLGRVFRKTVCIRLRLRLYELRFAILEWMFQELKLLIQTQKVVVAIELPYLGGGPFDIDGPTIDDFYRKIEYKIKDIIQCLVPALGPAVFGHIHHPGHAKYATILIFHPQKNRAIILRGRAKLMRSDADRLDREADRLDRDTDSAEPNA